MIVIVARLFAYHHRIGYNEKKRRGQRPWRTLASRSEDRIMCYRVFANVRMQRVQMRTWTDWPPGTVNVVF
ncbi:MULTISPECIES: hypothetical protein [Chloroflexus]|uniref:hypothetical protein n=1 Tax=Chloroflexus TaxID=1107 RepID=UPI00138A1B3A|nr:MULTISPECIES: hypothetical protein [Chloroflexus]